LLCEALADTEDVTVGDDLLPEADEDAVVDVLLCVALALIEDVAVGEDLLCETLADTEDVAMGDDLLPEADEDAVGDAAAAYKLRPHSEDEALVVAVVDDGQPPRHFRGRVRIRQHRSCLYCSR